MRHSSILYGAENAAFIKQKAHRPQLAAAMEAIHFRLPLTTKLEVFPSSARSSPAHMLPKSPLCQEQYVK